MKCQLNYMSSIVLYFFTHMMFFLKNVDYGRMAEILVQRAGSPDEFTRLTAITWVKANVLLQ